MANTIITLTSTKVRGASFLKADSKDKYAIANAIIDHLGGMAGGCRTGSLDIQVNGGTTGVQATGTLTLASVVANDTCVVGTQTFTAKVSPSGANQYALGASDTTAATNLAAAVNAHASLKGVATATSAIGVVTLTCPAYGLLGNLVTLTGSTDITASNTTLTGGAATTANTFTYSGNA